MTCGSADGGQLRYKPVDLRHQRFAVPLSIAEDRHPNLLGAGAHSFGFGELLAGCRQLLPQAVALGPQLINLLDHDLSFGDQLVDQPALVCLGASERGAGLGYDSLDCGANTGVDLLKDAASGQEPACDHLAQEGVVEKALVGAPALAGRGVSLGSRVRLLVW